MHFVWYSSCVHVLKLIVSNCAVHDAFARPFMKREDGDAKRHHEVPWRSRGT